MNSKNENKIKSLLIIMIAPTHGLSHPFLYGLFGFLFFK